MSDRKKELREEAKALGIEIKGNPGEEKLQGMIGEDIGFCSELRKAGKQIFVDTFAEPGDEAPTATTTADQADLFSFRYNGAKWLAVGTTLDFSSKVAAAL